MTIFLDGGTRLVEMGDGVFGFAYPEALGREDFEQVLRHMQLGLGVINTYMRYITSTLFN